jgi:hypothetical protein
MIRVRPATEADAADCSTSIDRTLERPFRSNGLPTVEQFADRIAKPTPGTGSSPKTPGMRRIRVRSAHREREAYRWSWKRQWCTKPPSPPHRDARLRRAAGATEEEGLLQRVRRHRASQRRECGAARTARFRNDRRIRARWMEVRPLA